MWFNDVFLQSLFERAGAGKSLWLSRKQTAVCINHMEKKTVSFSDGFGTYRHDNYFYSWKGRQVILSYSKMNGCGSISFGMNKEEQENAAQERELERRQLELDSVERLKRHPERLEKRVKALKEQEESFLFDLSFEDNTQEDIKFYTKKLNEVRRLLNLYQS